MPVITLFSASHCHGEQVCQGVVDRLGPQVLTTEELLAETADRYSITAEKLGRAMHGPRSFFHRWTRRKSAASPTSGRPWRSS